MTRPLTRPFRLALRPLTALGLLICAQGAPAAEEALPESCPDKGSGFVMPGSFDRRDAPLHLQAREFDITRPEFEFSGRVQLRRADQRLETDVLVYNDESGRISLPGPLHYADDMLELDAASAEYNLLQESGRFDSVSFRLGGALGRGDADRSRLEQGQRLILDKVMYTTCPEGRTDWRLDARAITLDQPSGRGTARGATLRFKGVPLLYAPRFSFPVDDRRLSGFLFPSLGSANDNGLDLSIPWYWNIAPNHDATFTPRIISDRGYMLGAEYRWLTPRTRGRIDVDYLPDDDATGDNRHHYVFEHGMRIRDNWRTALHLARVSDDRYFEDFGRGLNQTARQFLRSTAVLEGRGRFWNFSMGADDFQVIDSGVGANREPYRRLPRIVYDLDMPLGASLFDFKLDGEVVYFDRDTGVTGGRADLLPMLLWNYERGGAYVRPAAGYRLTRYALDDDPALPDTSPDRKLFIGSLDAGLFFDRVLGSGKLQTLEPRIFYLYVPYEDQNGLPDFDTSELTFGFSQLFHYNRFSGADRQGDANQLTVAVTSRILDPRTGREQFSISAGQLFYFDDRRVPLAAGAPPETYDHADLVAEVAYHPWRGVLARAGLQWDWDQDRVDVGWAGLEFDNGGSLRLAADYRFRRDRIEQVDFRADWRLTRQWSLTTRWIYSLDEKNTQEALAGIEYRSCCWAFRIMTRRYLKNHEGESRNTIYLELELTGLGRIGRSPRALFRRDPFQL